MGQESGRSPTTRSVANFIFETAIASLHQVLSIGPVPHPSTTNLTVASLWLVGASYKLSSMQKTAVMWLLALKTASLGTAGLFAAPHHSVNRTGFSIGGTREECHVVDALPLQAI